MAHEERICRRAELAFGRSLPPELGAPVIERALGTLAMADEEVAPRIDWNEARRRQDAIDRAAR
jgi:DNA-binding transcriptional regulator YdaS (Cro superfamily)